MKNSDLQTSQMQTLQQSSYLDAGNAEYLEDLYEQYLQDPQNEATLERILIYNEDDCRAMVAVKEYFERATK